MRSVVAKRGAVGRHFACGVLEAVAHRVCLVFTFTLCRAYACLVGSKCFDPLIFPRFRQLIMSKRSVSLDRLNEVHSFPGTYEFKVIGVNNEEFIDRVVEAALEVVGADAERDVSTRESSGGKHVSVTVSVEVENAEAVLEVYDEFKQLEDVHLIL